MQLLQLLGIEYIVVFVAGRAKEENKHTSEMIYIAEAISLVPQGARIKRSLYDILYPDDDDGKTGEEIAEDIIKRHNFTREGEIDELI